MAILDAYQELCEGSVCAKYKNFNHSALNVLANYFCC